MKLSVIIPVYNRAELIKDTIDSVLCCGLDDFEIIVVDDGSTDRTPDVVRAMGPPVRYLRQTNAGPGPARNTGFAASRAEYVAFLDSDDHWLPGAVPTLVKHLDEQDDIPLIFGDAQMGSPATGFASVLEMFGGAAFENLPSREVGPGVRRLERGPFFRLNLRKGVVFFGALVMRRDVFGQVGGFDTSLFVAEDFELGLRLALRYEFCYCEGLTVAVRHRHSSNLSDDHDFMNAGFCKAFERLLEIPGLAQDERVLVLDALRRIRIGYAYRAYDRGDLPVARARFSECLRSGFAWYPFLYWLACQLPASIVTRARHLKQKRSGYSASPPWQEDKSRESFSQPSGQRG
jgi:glycosyltransferase involved in cell wall biosynthesis